MVVTGNIVIKKIQFFYIFHWESSDHLGSCFHGFINSYDFDQSILAP